MDQNGTWLCAKNKCENSIGQNLKAFKTIQNQISSL